MNDTRFDIITRAWHTGSRRRMLGALVAAAVAPLMPHRAGAECVEGTTQEFACAIRECIDGAFVTSFDEGNECSPSPSECVAASFCTGGSLGCPPNRNVASGTACDDDGNPCTSDICANGACAHPAKPDGTPCPTGVCRDGLCVVPADDPQSGACGAGCGEGTACCSGVCVNLEKSKRNCGVCGKRCRKGKRCRGGRCR